MKRVGRKRCSVSSCRRLQMDGSAYCKTCAEGGACGKRCSVQGCKRRCLLRKGHRLGLHACLRSP